MANNAVVGVLRALLTLDSAEFESGMKKVSDEFKAQEKAWGKLGKQATDLGSALTKSLTVPIVGVGVAAAKAAIDFESSFAGIRKTVSAAVDDVGELTETGRALQKGMLDLSKRVPVNVNELNKIGEAAGQLGIRSENILTFTETIARLGVTTNLSTEQAAMSLARLAAITGMPQEQFSNLGSAITSLGNHFETTESEIVDFGLRIAGVGKLANLSEADIVAIGAAFTSVGVQAEAGGTAVQKVFLSMIDASREGGDALDTFAETAGMTANEFKRYFANDAAGAFTAFVEGLGEQGQMAGATLDRLHLGDERLTRAFLGLASAGTQLRDAIGDANLEFEKNEALTKESDQRFKTMANQIQLVWNAVYVLGVELGNTLRPTILAVIEGLNRLIPIANTLAQTFAAMPTWFQSTAIGVTAAAAALGPLIWGFGQVALVISSLAGAFKSSGIAAKAFIATMEAGTIVARGFWVATLGVAGVAAAALWGLKTASDAYGVSVDKSEDALRKEIAALNELGTVMARSRAQALQRVLDDREGAEASQAKTRAAEEERLELERLQATKARLSGANEAAEIDRITKSLAELREEGKLTPERLKVIATELEGLQMAGALLTPALQAIVTQYGKLGNQVPGLTDDQKDYREEVKRLVTTLSGSGAIRQLKQLEDAYEQLSRGQTTNLHLVEDIIDAYENLRDVVGSEVSPALEKLYRQVQQTATQNQRLSDTANELGDSLAGVFRTANIPRLNRQQLLLNGQQAAKDIVEGLMVALPAELNTPQVSQAFELPPFQFTQFDWGASLKASLGNAVAEIPKMLSDLLSGRASLEQVGSQIGAAIGAAIGGVIGAYFGGPIGFQIGSAAGAAAGSGIAEGFRTRGEDAVRRLGHDWGVYISEEMGNAIAQTARTKFAVEPRKTLDEEGDWTGDLTRFELVAAEIYHLGDIMKEYGVQADTATVFTAKLRDVFVMLERGIFTTADAQTVLNESFGQLAAFFEGGRIPAGLKEIIDLTRRFGIESQAVNEFLQQQAARAQAGLKGIVDNALAENKDGLLEGLINQEQFDRFQRLAAVSFGAAIAAGDPFLQTLLAMDDQFGRLNRAADQFGLSKIAAFGDLSALQGFFAANEHLAGSIDGVNQMMEALYNSNLLTQESFNDLAGVALDDFNAMLAGGLSVDQAMLAQQQTLQTMWELWKEGTVVVDEQTEALLRQAEQSGRVGEKHMSAQERMIAAQERAAEASERTAKAVERAFGAAGDDAEDFASRATKAIDALPSEKEFVYRGRLVLPDGFDMSIAAQTFANEGRIDSPTLAIVGDAPEPEFVLRESTLARLMGAGMQSPHFEPPDVILNVDGRELARTVMRLLPGELAVHGVRPH